MRLSRPTLIAIDLLASATAAACAVAMVRVRQLKAEDFVRRWSDDYDRTVGQPNRRQGGPAVCASRPQATEAA